MPAPPPGHGDFWATVHVKFPVPLPDIDDPEAAPAQGYYRSLGIRAVPSRVQMVIAAAIEDGVIDWSDTEWHLVDPEGLDSAIRARVTDVKAEGVWYESGRAVYADPDLGPRPS